MRLRRGLRRIRRLFRPSSDRGSRRSRAERRPSDEEIGERRQATFRQLLGLMPPGRLLDLAAGHGLFSLIGQELGWEVTAVDARLVRMPMLPGIRWIEADVRTFDVAGYDCIAVLGVLYHLGLVDQRALLRRCAGTPTILDTHHARRAKVTVDGFEGRFYREPGRSAEELAQIATASWGNAESFWPTRESLVRMLEDAGYRTVFALEPPILPGRTFYLCL
jgi:hypothetical protein